MKYKLAAHELFAIAIVAMLIDHVGYCFGVSMWWRVFRMFALVWFIPLGYIPRRPTANIYAGAAMLAAADQLLGFRTFPLDVLFTIIAIKWLIEPLMTFATRNRKNFWLVMLALLVAYPLTNKLCEYGTLALLLAMAGWIMRNEAEIPPGVVNIRIYMAAVTALFIIAEQVTFHFSALQLAFVAVTTGLTAAAMLNLRQMILNDLSRKERDPITDFCQFLGHKTIDIYVVTWLLLKVLLISAIVYL